MMKNFLMKPAGDQLSENRIRQNEFSFSGRRPQKTETGTSCTSAPGFSLSALTIFSSRGGEPGHALAAIAELAAIELEVAVPQSCLAPGSAAQGGGQPQLPCGLVGGGRVGG